MAIRMRYGLEAEFNPSKMVVGEWAVSTDSRFVRMCFAPGVVLRMATYEAFEADMTKIKAILAECKDIQTAITRIQSEVNANAVLCAEYAESAKKSADAAAESAEQAKMYAENASAVTNVQIATKDIAGLIKGGDNHIAEDGTLVLTDRTATGLLQPSHAGGIRLHSISAVEDRQERTTGAQLLNTILPTTTINGITFTRNDDGTYTLNGTATAFAFALITDIIPNDFAGCKVVGAPEGASWDTYFIWGMYRDADNNELKDFQAYKDGAIIESAETYPFVDFRFLIREGQTLNNVVFKPMVTTNLDATYDDYEPYTGRKPSPAPGEPVVTSTNQLKLNGTTQTVNGVNYAPDTANGFIALVGESTIDTALVIGTAKLEAGTYYASISGNPQGAIGAFYTFNIKDADGTVLASQGKESADYSYAEFEFILTEAQMVTYEIELGAGEVMDNELAPMIATTSGATFDAYTVEYTEGYPQAIEGTVMKNLLPKATSRELSGVSFTVNEDGSIYVKGTSTESRSFDFANLKLPKGEYISSVVIFHKNSSGVTIETIQPDTVFSVADDTEYLVPIIWINNGTAYDMTVYPMIRPAEILDDTYVPYGCMRVVGVDENGNIQSTILSKPFSEFHNIGGEGDKLTADAEVRRFATVVFDGSEEWVLEQNMFTHPLSVQAKAYKSALCDKFICVYSYNDCNWTDGSFAVSDKYLRVNASGIDSVDEWKAYLSAHPMTVTYELATEQITPLPTADQIALHSLKSYDGVTHLYTDTYPQMVIDAEYGTSKVGAEMYEALNKADANEIRYNELASALLALNQE